jgi:N4-gp56 family major capsid protein
MAMNWVDQNGYLTNNKLSMDFQKVAQPLFRFRQFVDTKEAFGKQQGQAVNWLKVANVSDYGKQVAETNVAPETTQTLTWGTTTVTEYMNSVPFTFKLEALSEFDIKAIIKGGLMDDMVKVIDGTVEREFNKTPLRYIGTTTTTGTCYTASTASSLTNTSELNSYHIRKMRLELEKRLVPAYDGDFVCIASLEAAESLEGALETVNSYTETGYKRVMDGEIGRIHGVRVVKDSWASRNVFDAAAGTATATSWTIGKSGPAYMFGKPTVMEAVAVPEEIRLKVVTDYGRSKGMAWYFLGGWSIMWSTEGNARIIKWDSVA